MASRVKSKICFFFQKEIPLRDRRKLRLFLETRIREERRRLKFLNLVFCSDEEVLRINRDHLKHDFYTDIITFELSPTGAPLEAEIYISVDRVRENAQKLGESIKRELYRVIFHGVLHLCGYADKTTDQRKEMRAKEDEFLRKYLS